MTVDDADIADREIENNLAGCVIASMNYQKFVACGVCYGCGNDLPLGRLYCNNVCAGDHASEMKHQAEMGR